MSATPLPAFAAERADTDRYAVETKLRPNHDHERIRLRDRTDAPAMLTVLTLIRATNADGWLLDKHSHDGDELVFVPSAEEADR